MRGKKRLYPVLSLRSICAAICISLLSYSAYAQDNPAKPLELSTKDIQSLPQDARINLLAMRLNRSLLDDRNIMKYFILLNNCGGPSSIQAAVSSEFDFPKLATFYKSHVDEILGSVPHSVSMDVGPLSLGEYDMGKKAFPFVAPVPGYGGKPIMQPITAEGITLRDAAVTPRCGSPSDQWFGPNPAIISTHVSFPKITFTDFPVDETAARDYVAFVSSGHASVRFVFLRVDMEILDNPARLINHAVDFDGRVTKITVFSTRDNHTATAPIGVLYP